MGTNSSVKGLTVSAVQTDQLCVTWHVDAPYYNKNCPAGMIPSVVHSKVK
jgi:hypothetical protein